MEETVYTAEFHFTEGEPQKVTLVTSPDDEETLEEFLTAKLTAAKFTGFGDGAGGFVLINVDLVTRVDVQQKIG